jgi:hypothetical protein
MATREILEKVALLALDKVLFGLVIAGVAFWFQRRLERVKRDQGLYAEQAKAATAAFNRILGAIYEIRADVIAGTVARSAHFFEERKTYEKVDRLGTLIQENRHLTGRTFSTATLLYCSTARRMATAPPPSEADYMDWDLELERMLPVVHALVPRFARMPADDSQFAYPTRREALREAGLPDDALEFPPDPAERSRTG